MLCQTVQKDTPEIVVHAAQCVAAKNFLPPSQSKSLSFGYFVDAKSHPGERVLYLVNYASLTFSEGLIFTIFLTQAGGQQVFNIQNNAEFVLPDSEPTHVSFRTEPLGGTWTHEHLARAILEIEAQPKFSVPVPSLGASNSSIKCEAYTDR
jgi:hypothetical protein